MNEKFFDLKKEKQDRIINAALKVFAGNGYVHASTDDIVKEAEISKGLLFHYFISKLGLYSFLYDYAAKYVTLEIRSSVTADRQDYFALRKLIAFADMQVMRNYPDMILFMENAAEEKNPEAADAIQASRTKYEQGISSLYEQSDRSMFQDPKAYARVDMIMQYTISGISRKHFNENTLQPEMLFTEINDIIEQVRKLVMGA